MNIYINNLRSEIILKSDFYIMLKFIKKLIQVDNIYLSIINFKDIFL